MLAPYHFGAFNPGSLKRGYYTSLYWDAQAKGFQRALSIAYQVMTAPEHDRPFQGNVLRFYSPVSMKPAGSAPAWADESKRVSIDVDQDRFRFFADIP